MGKGRIFGSVALVVSILAAVWWSGCGNSNDQGISFRTLGYFHNGKGTAGDAGRCADLSNDVNVPQSSGDFDPKSNPGGGGFLGLQNNMVQGINLDHVDLSYHVNGASIAIPNDVAAIAGRLGPSSGQEPNNPNILFLQSTIVGPNIFKFLNDNRTLLPDPPFSMVVFATAVGTTDGGDVFRTNRANYEVTFVEGQIVCGSTPTAVPASASPTP